MNIRLGLDFGGVIVKAHDRNACEDTTLSFADRMDVAHDGALEGIKTMVSLTGGAVWIVSKAGPKMQQITRDWLDAVDFYSKTSMARDHLCFCEERPQKETICTSLNITHFVDDRLHIMQILRHCVPNLLLFGTEKNRRFCPPWASLVTNWPELMKQVFI